MLPSERGALRCAYHAAPAAETAGGAAVVMVGGGDGGLDGPAEALYPELARALAGRGIAALRVDFRVHGFPGDLAEAVFDVRTALTCLAERGVRRAGLLGHSFGGAVVIEAAVDHPLVASVATLASQTAGAQRVGELAPRPVLFVHGMDDIRLPPECSRELHRLARSPTRLELLAGATHSLRQRRADVLHMLREWFTETLSGPPAPG